MPHIRRARRDDAAAIARLCTQLGYAATARDIAPRIAAACGDDRRVVVATGEDGRVLGLMQVSIHHAIESGSWAEIDALVVDETHRSGGIGRSLVEHAGAWAVERGMARLRVRTNEKRNRAHAFYERLGFTLAKLQRIYDLPLTGNRRPPRSR
jgi:GNAT superfamily N-acetyltransferase